LGSPLQLPALPFQAGWGVAEAILNNEMDDDPYSRALGIADDDTVLHMLACGGISRLLERENHSENQPRGCSGE
jgi:hypothetical protein